MPVETKEYICKNRSGVQRRLPVLGLLTFFRGQDSWLPNTSPLSEDQDLISFSKDRQEGGQVAGGPLNCIMRRRGESKIVLFHTAILIQIIHGATMNQGEKKHAHQLAAAFGVHTGLFL